MIIQSPTNGKLHPITDAPDPVFSQEMLGSGVVLFPSEDQPTIKFYAPMTGSALKIMPHAFILHNGEHGILVHVGIDTVNLDGKGFTLHAKEGTTVNVGDLVVEVDVATVQEAGFSLATPILLMDSQPGSVTVEGITTVEVGDTLFEV